MIHTFEVSRMVTKEVYEKVISTLKIRYYPWNDTGFHMTTDYSDQGFQMIRLYKFKDKIYEKQMEGQPKDDRYLYCYMIALSINPSVMLGDDPYHSFDILSFGPAFVRGIYGKILSLIPCLEINRQLRVDAQRESRLMQSMDDEHCREWNRLREDWLEQNKFRARRIDFAFDIWDNPDLYLMLLDKGYSLRKGNFDRTYFDDAATKEEIHDNEPDIPDVEEVQDANKPQTDYIYYKGKSLNINIYHKGREVEREGLGSNSSDLNFVRIEVQVKKGKLNSILVKMKKGNLSGYEDYDEMPARDLQSLVIPEVGSYVLDHYVHALAGSGHYVKYGSAVDIIDGSDFGKLKKEKLKAVIREVDKCEGIAKLLELVENGAIKDFGKLSTVKTHLRDIHKLGINPVVLPDDVSVSNISIIDNDGNILFTGEGLYNPVYLIKSYGDKLKGEKRYGRDYTEGELDGV